MDVRISLYHRTQFLGAFEIKAYKTLEDYGSEIYFASIEDDEERARAFINEVYGGIEELSRDTIINYFNIEDFAETLFYDYSFVDGFVFLNFNLKK